MNYLEKLSKNIMFKKKKTNVDSINSFIVFAVVGVAIGGAIVGIFARNCLDELKNVIINNAKDADEDIDLKREQIKQTLENAEDESVGDVGAAMEKAFEDLKDEQ